MNLWDQILARVETKVNRHSFYTWFEPTSFVAEDARRCHRAGGAVFKDWLTKHYSAVTGEAMAEINQQALDINFVAEGSADVPAMPLTVDEATVFNYHRPLTTGPAGLNPPLHVRYLHRRLVEPVRPRRRKR